MAGPPLSVLGDHPRMRGEHVEVTEGEIDAMGSSPHARGAREAPAQTVGVGGIIPACAGSTTAPAA